LYLGTSTGGGGTGVFTLTLNNSIVAGNAGNDDIAGFAGDKSFIVGGHNLLGSVAAGNIDSSGIENESTKFSVDVSVFLTAGKPVVNVQGTPTIALLGWTGSLAVDKADPALAPATDQRGLPRFGDAPDIGAFELQTELKEKPDDYSDSGNSGCDTGSFALSGLTATALFMASARLKRKGL